MADPDDNNVSEQLTSVRPARSRAERAKVGLLGTFGWLAIFGVGAAIGAIMGWQDVRGWIIGVAVSGATVLLGFLLRRALR